MGQDVTVNGGAGALTVAANSDIRLTSVTWTGDHAGKIQHHSNSLYIQGGSGTYAIILRDNGGSDRWYVKSYGAFEPASNNSYDIGTSSNRVRNIYTMDLQLSNEDNDIGNEIDGTKGSWTIQEGEDDLYLLNRKNGKKYKFKLEEIT